MTALDIKKALFNRNFFRFTGPPENWLTAIKYMTWGLEKKYRDRWAKIQVGDVFLMHSTTQSLFYPSPRSTVVGLGVVGGQFRMKDNFLWVQEIQSQRNIWPLLVPFSEIYLFSELTPAANWEAPGLGNNNHISPLIDALLKNAVPISTFSGFPVMGSWSSVKNELVDNLFAKVTPTLYDEFYTNEYQTNVVPEFSPVKEAEETVRYVPSLKFLDGNKVKVRKAATQRSTFDRDNAILERAEENHAEVLQAAIDIFRKRGFDTWSNQHVDLLAESEDQAFLIEVKSTLSSNFRTQARTAIGQLFEYEHFDVRHYFEGKSKVTVINKVLMVTNDPKEDDYPSFLNSLKVNVAWPRGTRISVRGEVGGLSQFIPN